VAFFCTVEPGHRAIVFNRYSGVLEDVKVEGINLKIPFVEVTRKQKIAFNPYDLNSSLALLAVSSLHGRSGYPSRD
jgi:hypothetical protein